MYSLISEVTRARGTESGFDLSAIGDGATRGKPSLSKTAALAVLPNAHNWRYINDPLACTASVT